MSENRHVKKYKKKHLGSGDSIVATCEGYTGKVMGSGKDTQVNGSLIVTNEKVIFYKGGVFGEKLESIPLKNISSVERKSTLGHRTITITTSNNEIVFKTLEKTNEQLVCNAINAKRDQIEETADLQESMPDPIEKIKKLSELKNQGILTESEFQKKKDELLSEV